MNYDIDIKQWPRFFDELSKYRWGWKTAIEVLDPNAGSQILADGLPLNGITADGHRRPINIDISIGQTTDAHQSHAIRAPVRVSLLAGIEAHRDVVSITEKNGTRTLIRFIEPRGLLLAFKEMRMAAAA